MRMKLTWVAVLSASALLSGCLDGMAVVSGSIDENDKAPEFAGIGQWHNSEPLTLEALRGKVVLVEFWTYTCVNCLRTLPHVNQWYETYKDRDFVIVGVHTPEYPEEHDTQNVAAAIRRLGIAYPVAQDNEYATWKAYDNQAWPASYLIDRQGRVVRRHYGEGEYEEMEQAIRKLLAS